MEYDPTCEFDASIYEAPTPKGHTGHVEYRTVTYIIREGFGIPEGYCIMGLSLPQQDVGEQPYKPVKQKLSLTRWNIEGPTKVDGWFPYEADAQGYCDALNAAFAAGRAVPSPVGQEPVAWMIETKVWSDTSVMLAVSRDAVVQMAVERYRECEQKHVHHSDPIPLFTHPPKAGVLTALKAEDPTS